MTESCIAKPPVFHTGHYRGAGAIAGAIHLAILRGRCRVEGIKDAPFQPLIEQLTLIGFQMMLMLKRQVQSLIDKGAVTKAIGMAAEYVRRHPDCPTGHQLVAMAEEAAGYTRAAVQTITHAIDLASKDPSLRIMRARLLVKDHRLKEAIADVEAIIAMSDPRRDEQQLRYAVACRDELIERLATAIPPRGPQQTTRTCSLQAV